jgi:coenzyme F420-reducing hydrogenase beta subunit
MTLDPLRRLIEANHDKRLAVTAQPCHIDAVKAYSHVAVGIAPFCGFNMEAAATPYLIARSGAPPDRIREIRYRGGPYPGGFVAVADNGAEYHLRKEHYECANLLFMAPPCFRCRRYIAAGADIAIGDAWIRGQSDCSLVIAVTETGESIVRDLVAGGHIVAYAISREQIARMHAHNIKIKSRGAGLLLRCALRAGRMPGVRALAPFRLAGLASRMRRALTMGVAMRLKPLERQ